MKNIAAKTLLKLKQAIHRVQWVGIGRNAEHIIFAATICLDYLHGFPL